MILTYSMILPYSTISTLEKLPDELLLLICRYLSSPDILFSFYGLNSRLSRTISGYCQHVVLAQVPFKQFNYICESILSNIGSHICSLVVSNQWIENLSKTFLDYFSGRMYLIFPSLKHLTLFVVKVQQLLNFIDCLRNLTSLSEVTIHRQFNGYHDQNDLQNLLYRILLANNHRLKSIKFDTYSESFPVLRGKTHIIFSNIEKLNINLQTTDDLHRLLTALPNLCHLTTKIDYRSGFETKSRYSMVLSLKHFHLQSFGSSWNFDELAAIVKRIPNVKELSIAIGSENDIQLINGEMFLSIFSALSLDTFNYFLRLRDSSSINNTTILSAWQQFPQEFVCIRTDDNKVLALYTLPFTFSSLILPSSLAQKKVFIKSYAPQVEDLVLCQFPARSIDIFPIIRKCYRLGNLTLQIDKYAVPSKNFS